MGKFIFLDVNCSTNATKNSRAWLFLDAMINRFVCQLVTELRKGNAILDLVFISNEYATEK